ncbi:hypothetical protein GPALN_011155 [Globodera pallida]|nr:hypothetical protein GPALN_011155 [Globodera pallida]
MCICQFASPPLTECGFGVVCPPSLPPFRCLRGSCCRDQRPLFARLGPIVYPQDLLGGFGGISPGTFGGGLNSLIDLTCFDSALNCYLFQPYCFVPIYQLCMFTNCRRTCGYCGLGTFGGFGGLGAGNLGGFGGGLLGGTGGLNGFGGLGTFGASPVAPGIATASSPSISGACRRIAVELAVTVRDSPSSPAYRMFSNSPA